MAKPTAQQCHALTTYFINAYNDRYVTRLQVNRNKARWGFEAVLMDYSPSEARELIDYYIEHYERPSVEWFLFNYDKVEENREARQQEKSRSAQRRADTEQKMKEWRERWRKS